MIANEDIRPCGRSRCSCGGRGVELRFLGPNGDTLFSACWQRSTAIDVGRQLERVAMSRRDG